MFFRAGVLGQMEELRDERLSKIIGWLQSYIRGYIARKEFKKLQDQRSVNRFCYIFIKNQNLFAGERWGRYRNGVAKICVTRTPKNDSFRTYVSPMFGDYKKSFDGFQRLTKCICGKRCL